MKSKQAILINYFVGGFFIYLFDEVLITVFKLLPQFPEELIIIYLGINPSA